MFRKSLKKRSKLSAGANLMTDSCSRGKKHISHVKFTQLFFIVFIMDANFPFEELDIMHLAFDEALCNGRKASRLYEDRYRRRRPPHHTTFASGGGGHSRIGCTVQFKEENLHRVEKKSSSVRAVAHQMSFSRTRVAKSFRNNSSILKIYNAYNL